MWLRNVVDHYFLGKSVDNATNFALEKLSKTYPEDTRKVIMEHYSTPAKVAMCWMALSGILAFATSGVVAPATGFVIGALGCIPFVKPLMTHLSSHVVKCYQKYSCLQVVVSITGIALVCFGGYKLLFIGSPVLRSYNILSMFLSNLSLDASLALTTRFIRLAEEAPQTIYIGWFGSRTKLSLDQIEANRLKKAKADIAIYSCAIRRVKKFLNERPELQQMCAKYWEQDQPLRVELPPKNVEAMGLDEDSKTLLKAQHKAIRLEYHFDAFIRFIQSHRALMDAFKKHLQLNLDAQITPQLALLAGNGAKIEELN